MTTDLIPATACRGSMSANCDQRDIQVVVVGDFPATPHALCGACRTAALNMGLPWRPYVARPTERRFPRFYFPFESRGRRAGDNR